MMSKKQYSTENVKITQENSVHAGDNKRTQQTIEQLLAACGLSITEREYRGYQIYFIELGSVA